MPGGHGLYLGTHRDTLSPCVVVNVFSRFKHFLIWLSRGFGWDPESFKHCVLYLPSSGISLLDTWHISSPLPFPALSSSPHCLLLWWIKDPLLCLEITEGACIQGFLRQGQLQPEQHWLTQSACRRARLRCWLRARLPGPESLPHLLPAEGLWAGDLLVSSPHFRAFTVKWGP